MMIRTVLMACLILFIGLAHEELVGAQDIARLQAGVVKVTAKPPSGTTNIGTGFIVRMDKDAAYIVTAAHVVAGGDTHPKVEFFTKRNLPVAAEVLGLEGGDEVRGLALLVVRGLENIPQGLTALSLAGAARLTGGADILVIGFPRNAGPWAIVKGNISSRQGRDVFFSPSVDSGHSGGPIFQGGKVVAVVGAGSQSVGRGVTVGSVEDFIEGFEILAQESTGSSSASMPPAPSVPPPDAVADQNSHPITQGREIIGPDGAPMVLVPAGKFIMGSQRDNEMGSKRDYGEMMLEGDERPPHLVYLDAFYIDQYEVRTTRYAKFFQETKRITPSYWTGQVLKLHGRKPVAGVDWNDAADYCSWAGKRLPTEAEWEKAARGTDERLYPWGNEKPNRELATFGYSSFGNFDVLTEVGSFERGKSPYGVYDLAGNVWEWVADWYDEHYYSNSPDRNPKGPSSGKYRVLRGGSWFYGPTNVRSAARYHAIPARRDGGIGFRCAQDAK